MSNPAKTPDEIEDVLASIRRLVADEPTRQRGSAPIVESGSNDPVDMALEQPEPEPASVERLVLTPSLRVAETDEADTAAVEENDQALNDEASLSDEDSLSGEEAHLPDPEPHDDGTFSESALLSALALEHPEEQEPASPEDAADQGDWRPEDRLSEYDTVGEGAEADLEEDTDVTAVDLPDDDQDAELEPSAMVEDDEQIEALEDDVANEADVADLMVLDGTTLETAEFESETGDDDWPGQNAEAALLSLVARREPAAPEEQSETAEGTDPEADEADVDSRPDPEDRNPSDRLVRAVAAVSDVHDDHENEGLVAADESDAGGSTDGSETEAKPVEEFTPVFSRRRTQAAPSADEEASGQAEDLEDETSLWAPPETDVDDLDEETLREIIVDVVREELQGVLGQRITRNVRKMVRREIRLALGAEDLE